MLKYPKTGKSLNKMANPKLSCNIDYHDCEYCLETQHICDIDGYSCTSISFEQRSSKCTSLSLDLSKVPNAEVSVAELERREKGKFPHYDCRGSSTYTRSLSPQITVPGFPGPLLKSGHLDFQSALRVQEDKKRQKACQDIAKLADHLD